MTSDTFPDFDTWLQGKIPRRAALAWLVDPRGVVKQYWHFYTIEKTMHNAAVIMRDAFPTAEEAAQLVTEAFHSMTKGGDDG